MASNRVFFQLIWGLALTIAGIGVFFRIPQVMPRIESIEQYSSFSVIIRIFFYILGIMLIGGGVKKIKNNYRQFDSDRSKR